MQDNVLTTDFVRKDNGLPPAGTIPEPKRPIPAVEGEEAAAGRKRQGLNPSGPHLEGEKPPISADVPEADRTVTVRESQDLHVRG